MIAINVWKLFPFVAIMVLAGLQSIPNDLYEAARVDGASFWDEVRYVMLPQVRPVIVAVTLLLVIWGLNSITIIYAITRGGPANKTLITPIQIFRLAFESVRLNQAAALQRDVLRGRDRHRHHLHPQPSPARLRDDRARSALKRPGLGWPVIVVGCALLVAVCLFPFWWMVLSSFKTLRELYTVPPIWWPDAPTFDNYRKVIFESNIPRYFLNSVIISVGATGLALILAIFASYGFARFDFRGKPLLQAFVLIGQLLPTAAIIVPLFITLRVLGLVNTYWGLILVYMIITLPLSVWMLTSYFKAIPRRARRGGDHRRRLAAWACCSASRCRCRCRASSRCWSMPSSPPGTSSSSRSASPPTRSVKTLPIGLAEFSTEFNTDWGAVMAASVVMTLPIALLFLSMQRLFVGGLTAGATKGISRCPRPPAIPQLGLGTFGRTGDAGMAAILTAIEIGYRHIDTAQSYDTERQRRRGDAPLRPAARASSSSPPRSPTPTSTKRPFVPSVERSLEAIGVDQVDLLLIHWPSQRDAVPLEDYMHGARRGARRRAGAADRRLELHRSPTSSGPRRMLGDGAIATEPGRDPPLPAVAEAARLRPRRGPGADRLPAAGARAGA